ncbi:LicD family protein [uncultured Shimia sp.]|uniref:LicD family protein n=1 Tax=uncultured Shimia sp. TaxID=573152 RepID=UPI002621D8D7|nr:LicD family protein [uncultured Shimia sp.]
MIELVYKPRARSLRHYVVSEESLGALDPAQIPETALNVLADVAEILNDFKVLHYVCDGTLLGIVRDDGFIPGDGDIDFRVDRSALTNELIDAFKAEGFFAYKQSVIEGRLTNVGLFRDGLLVDLYVAVFANHSVMFELIFRKNHLSYQQAFDGVEPMQFHGVDVNVPRHASEHLRACFGPDWQQPTKTWDSFFSHKALCRCTGGAKGLLAAGMRFQTARRLRVRDVSSRRSWHRVRDALRLVSWVRRPDRT